MLESLGILYIPFPKQKAHEWKCKDWINLDVYVPKQLWLLAHPANLLHLVTIVTVTSQGAKKSIFFLHLCLKTAFLIGPDHLLILLIFSKKILMISTSVHKHLIS